MNMVIGEGVIFNRFIDYSFQSKYFIIAGGVNESTINDEAAILEEESSVAAALSDYTDATFLYFSSCSILDPDVQHTQYVRHKLRMEKLIQKTATNYFIFRLPQILGLSDTKKSLVSNFVDAIINHKKFEVWQNAKRNLIDIDDVHEIVSEILRRNIFNNRIVNIASPRQTAVLQLVRDIEDLTGCAANYALVNKGSEYCIDISDIQPILVDLKLDFGKNYVLSSLRKYFQHLICDPNRFPIIVPTHNVVQEI